MTTSRFNCRSYDYTPREDAYSSTASVDFASVDLGHSHVDNGRGLEGYAPSMLLRKLGSCLPLFRTWSEFGQARRGRKGMEVR